MREIHNCRFVSNPIKVRQLVGKYIVFSAITIVTGVIIVFVIVDNVNNGITKTIMIVLDFLITISIISVFAHLSTNYGAYGLKHKKILHKIHQIFN